MQPHSNYLKSCKYFQKTLLVLRRASESVTIDQWELSVSFVTTQGVELLVAQQRRCMFFCMHACFFQKALVNKIYSMQDLHFSVVFTKNCCPDTSIPLIRNTSCCHIISMNTQRAFHIFPKLLFWFCWHITRCMADFAANPNPNPNPCRPQISDKVLIPSSLISNLVALWSFTAPRSANKACISFVKHLWFFFQSAKKKTMQVN